MLAPTLKTLGALPAFASLPAEREKVILQSAGVKSNYCQIIAGGDAECLVRRAISRARCATACAQTMAASPPPFPVLLGSYV